ALALEHVEETLEVIRLDTEDVECFEAVEVRGRMGTGDGVSPAHEAADTAKTDAAPEELEHLRPGTRADLHQAHHGDARRAPPLGELLRTNEETEWARVLADRLEERAGEGGLSRDDNLRLLLYLLRQRWGVADVDDTEESIFGG